VDVDGYGVSMLDEIIAHRMGKDALRRHQAVHTDKHGNQRPVQTTKGWELLVRLRDTQDTVWYKLKDLKESHPVEVAQYDIDNDLDEEAAFRWWVPFTI
jgi:hypothetical protein